MRVSENSIVQWQLTDFLQANGHHVSICLPFLGKSATADLVLWLRMCIRDVIGMFLSVGIYRFPVTWDLVASTSLLVSLGSAHCWNISNNWNFLEIPKIWAAANLLLPLVTRVMCKQQQLSRLAPPQSCPCHAVSGCMAPNKDHVSKNISGHKFRHSDKFRQTRQVWAEHLSWEHMGS